MTTTTSKPLPGAPPRVAAGLKSEPPKPSDAILGPPEIRVERQGLTGRRWTWRFVRADEATVMKCDGYFSSAEDAYEAAQRAWNERPGIS